MLWPQNAYGRPLRVSPPRHTNVCAGDHAGYNAPPGTCLAQPSAGRATEGATGSSRSSGNHLRATKEKRTMHLQTFLARSRGLHAAALLGAGILTGACRDNSPQPLAPSFASSSSLPHINITELPLP